MVNEITVIVAVVTGVFTVIGATIPQVSAVIQSGRRAKEQQREQSESTRHDAYVTFLRSVGDLRTQIADNHDYLGDEIAARLALVRQHASAAQVNAVSVALRVPQPLRDLAMRVAAAARDQALAAEDTSQPPDFTELDKRVAAFISQVLNTSGA